MKIWEFHTHYSFYEVDVAGKRIRRTTSTHAPTRNQGEDSEWKAFESMEVQEDGCVLVIWGTEGPVLRRTLTSPLTYSCYKEVEDEASVEDDRAVLADHPEPLAPE